MPTGDRVIASQRSPTRGLGTNASIEIEHPATGHVTISFTSNFGFKQRVTIPRSWVNYVYVPNTVQLTFAGVVLTRQGNQVV